MARGAGLGVAAALAVVLFSGVFDGRPANGENGDTVGQGAEPALPAGVTRAGRSGTGAPAAIEIAYRVEAGDTPGAILVYVHPAGVADAGTRVELGRIFPFAPPGPDGTRRSTLQVPPDLAARIAEGRVLVEAVIDPEFRTEAVGGLVVEGAVILGEEG